MKKTISLILSAVFAASALASCAAVRDTGSNVRLTSSDAEAAAAWLEKRLGEKAENVVLGTNADGYGVDLSSLEDDGFFIRACGGEDVLILAKTPDGLDRAVRKYARAVERGDGIEEVTYHEGYRVKKLSIAGNDISEYAIVRVSESDPCVTTAASELSLLIEKACGVSLPVCTEKNVAESGRARRIDISSGDESLGDEGFTIAVAEDGTLSVKGGKWRGSLFGVYDLLEDIGWRFIAVTESYYDALVPADRQEYLYEADHIDLTAQINRTEIPSIPIRGGCVGLRQKNTYSTQTVEKYGGYGFAIRACHGLQNYNDEIFSGEYAGLYPGFVENGSTQPCFTNEDILEAIDAFALRYVKERLDAGQQIGKEIITVDVAHWDGGLWTFCHCKNCQSMALLEGCYTGAVMRMANRVCALLDENYPGVCASILGYGPTGPVPKITRPAKNLYVAFCFFDCDDYNSASCQNHCVSGVECDTTKNSVTNYYNAFFFEEWTKVLDPKMIQIWYYPSEGYGSPAPRNYYVSPLYTTILEDMKYIASFGVEHVYYCMERTAQRNNGLNCEGLFEYLGAKFMWDASITEEEAYDVLLEWFEIVCGKEAAKELLSLAQFAERAGDLAGCWCSYETFDRVNYEYVAAHADELWDKCMRACALAGDDEGEAFARNFTAGIMYMILRGTYEDMYVNGTDAEREVYSQRCRVTWERMCSVFGDDPSSFELDPTAWPK